MALPQYPAEDFDRGKELLKQLGSFWVNIFQDADILQAHLRSSGHIAGQTYLNFLEASATLSKATVPVFHTQNWFLLTAKKSAADDIAAIYKADDLVYGPQSGDLGRPAGFTYSYGGTDQPGVVFIPLPPTMAGARFTMQNMVVYPSKVWVADLDYTVDVERGVIAFRTNPFLDPMVPKRDVLDDVGQKIDEEIALWVYHGEFDLNYVYIHFGYALGLKLKSSQGYKDLLNAFWDMHVLGGSVELLTAFLSALSGAPTVIGPEETVEIIRVESTSQLVITNKQVYRFGLGANILVAEGDVVRTGQALSDAVQIAELAGANPDYSLLPSLSLSKSFLSGGYFAELSFKNHLVDLEFLGADDQGKTIIRFETTGYPGDVDTFWEFVHAQGVAQNKTLANMLDTREDPTTEPGPLNLPVKINPMQFVIENLLRNNLFIIRVRQASFTAGASGINFFRLLRDVVPPHTTYVVFIELTPPDDSIDLDQPGDEDVPGAEEELTVFHGVTADDDEMLEVSSASPGDPSYGDVHVSARLVSLTCQ